jgi:hypothetical protein
MMNPLHEHLFDEYSAMFAALVDGLVGEAAAFAISEGPEPGRSPDPGAYERLTRSAQLVHRHVSEHDVFGFPVPETEEGYRPLLTAALEFGAAIAAVERILNTPERDKEGDDPFLSAACQRRYAAGKALLRAALDAFGIEEETPC